MKAAGTIICLHSGQGAGGSLMLMQRCSKHFITTKPLALSCYSHKLSGRRKTNRKCQRFHRGKSDFKESVAKMPIVPWIIVFPQPSVSGVCTADALLHYVHYHFGATSAGRAAAFPSPDAPLSELTLWAPGNAHCQHTLSSLTSTKAAGVIFGF